MNEHIAFKLIPVDRGRDDQSGDLEVSSITSEGFLRLVSHFDVLNNTAPNELTDLFNKQKFTRLLTGSADSSERSSSSKYEAYYYQQAELGDDLFQPYRKEYIMRTGMDIPDQCFPTVGNWLGVYHTHFLQDLRIEHGKLKASGFVKVGDWNGVEASKRAPSRFKEVALSRFSFRRTEPEYIAFANGLFKHNPAYGNGKRAPLEPSLEDGELFTMLMIHWLDRYATDAQKEVVATDVATMKEARCKGNLFTTRPCGTNLINGWGVDNTIHWSEFIKLGKVCSNESSN